MQTENEIIRDKTIAHEVYLQRYNKATTNKIMKLLAEAEKDLIKQLRGLELNGGTAFNLERTDKQLRSIQAIISESYALMHDDLVSELHDVAKYEQDWQKAMIEKTVPITLDMIAVAPQVLGALVESKPLQGKILKEWTDKLSADSFASLQSAVRMGLVEGQSYDQITKRIIGTKALQYNDGIMQLNRVKTQALVSTTVSHATNVARDSLYQQNSDVIKAVQWCSTLDGRTTTLCKSRDGKLYPIDSGERPPAHFRCRSSMTPVLKSWKEMGLKERDIPEGTRASMNGQVAETETYQTWLKKQPHAFQDETLGKARAEMFRNGTPLDRFVDDSGHSYTLAELRAKEGVVESANNKTITPNSMEHKTAQKLLNELISNAEKAKTGESKLKQLWFNPEKYDKHIDKRVDLGHISSKADYEAKTFEVLANAKNVKVSIPPNEGMTAGKFQLVSDGWIVLVSGDGKIITSYEHMKDKSTFEQNETDRGNKIYEHNIRAEDRKTLKRVFNLS